QLAQIAAGNTYFQAVDGGQINLAALTSFTGSSGQTRLNGLEAGRGGAVTASPVASLVNGSLLVHGNGTLSVGGLTTFQHGDIAVTADAPAGGSAVGGVLALPLTTVDESGSNGSPTFLVDGAGSRLDLSGVTT